MRKIIHIIPSIDEESSGPSYSVWRLCESLVNLKLPIILAALSLDNLNKTSPFFRVFEIGFPPKRLGISPSMFNWLRIKAEENEISLIHNHGMWMFNALYPGWIAKRFEIPYITSPRGTLLDYAFRSGSKWKRLFAINFK